MRRQSAAGRPAASLLRDAPSVFCRTILAVRFEAVKDYSSTRSKKTSDGNLPAGGSPHWTAQHRDSDEPNGLKFLSQRSRRPRPRPLATRTVGLRVVTCQWSEFCNRAAEEEGPSSSARTQRSPSSVPRDDRCSKPLLFPGRLWRRQWGRYASKLYFFWEAYLPIKTP